MSVGGATLNDMANNIENMIKHNHSDVRSNASAFPDCYFCAIAIYLIINSKRWLFHSMSFPHRLVYDFTQHSGSNWLKQNLGSLSFFFFLSLDGFTGLKVYAELLSF